MPHTTFILDYLRSRDLSRVQRFFHPLIKKFNSYDFGIKIYYKSDELNRKFSIRKSEFENLLIDDCTNVEKMMNIHLLLLQTIRMQIIGDIVELGCFRGTSAALLQKTLEMTESDKRLHVYDSFQGLPDRIERDCTDGLFLKGGDLKTSSSVIRRLFNERNLRLPEIHEGWFSDTLPNQLPSSISFAHLDGDFYESIMDSLVYSYPKLSRGAVVVIDDYCDPSVINVHNKLPGVKEACDVFFADKIEKVNVLLCGGQCHGYFIKE
jgi:O-methyltransferase